HLLVPLLLLPSVWPRFASRLRRYTNLLTSLYRAIRDVTGSRAIVDSSKAPSSAFVLRRVPGVELSAVHLVRDSPAVAYKWTRTVPRPAPRGRSPSRRRYTPSRVAIRWIARNTMMEMLGCAGVPELRIRQEDLVTSTGPVLERILTGLGVPFRPEDLAFVSDGGVVLHANHTVMGSPLRLRTGPLILQLDAQWKTA